jgi:enamine deaminase RidA (YjgF/YER057c/UK114 family)
VNITLAGQFGWDPVTQRCVEGGFVGQWERALLNVKTLVQAAGGAVTDIVSMRILVIDMQEYRAAMSDAGAAWGRVLGRHFPAITLYEVGALTDPDARLEIEAVACTPDGAAG